MSNLVKRSPVKFILTFFLIFTASVYLSAQEDHSSHNTESDHAENHKEKFQAGKFILEHILDSYEWHITTIGETHITIPLPIILYSNNSGFHIFMSSNFPLES